MSWQYSEKVQVKFDNASAYFSEEEWTLLEEWQKELYRNVMKEVHHALLSLGPLIASTVFTLRAQGKQELCPTNNQEPERAHVVNFSPGDSIANHGEMLSINSEESLHLNDNRVTEGRSINDCFIRADFCLRKEEDQDPIFIDDLGEEVGESSTNPSLGQEIISFHIKGEEDTYCIDQQGTTAIDVIDFIGSSVGKGSKNGKGKGGCSTSHAEKTTALKSVHGKGTAEVLKRPTKERNHRSQLWPGNKCKLGQERATHCKSGSVHPEHLTVYPPTSNVEELNVEESDTYNDFESNLWNKTKYQSKTQAGVRRYACPECQKSFRTNQDLSRHQRIHSGERPYHCTDCEKSFIRQHHLIQHQRTHTGEKPFHCTICEKSYSSKVNLNKHQKMHMAAY